MYIMWSHFDKGLVVSYFSFLLLFGVFFVVNLFVAVLSDTYEKITEEED